MEYYVYPTIVSLPLGYDCTVEVPFEQIGDRLAYDTKEAKIVVGGQAYRDGEIIFDETYELEYRDRKLVGDAPEPFVIKDQLDGGATNPAFFEMTITSAVDEPIFRTKVVFGLYSIYSKSGKKSFLSDNSYKYGSPPVIAQMAKFGMYVDAYPVIHLDKKRDLGETLVFINPYKRPILAKISTYDQRKLPRVKIPPESVRNVDLSALLEKDEEEWTGHIQITANNRLVTFSIKHSLRDITLVSDHEHLDPYRSDPTHEAATLAFRKWVGGKLRPFLS